MIFGETVISKQNFMVHVRMVFATPLFIMWIFPPGNSLGCSFCWTDAPDAWQNHCHSHMLHACHIYVIFTYIWVTVRIDSKCYGNIPYYVRVESYGIHEKQGRDTWHVPGAVLTYRNLNPESQNQWTNFMCRKRISQGVVRVLVSPICSVCVKSLGGKGCGLQKGSLGWISTWKTNTDNMFGVFKETIRNPIWLFCLALEPYLGIVWKDGPLAHLRTMLDDLTRGD